jgi:hypothetical protein
VTYHSFGGVTPSYEESATPSLPGLFIRTDQLDAVVFVRNWMGERGAPGTGFSGLAGTGVLIGPRLVLTAKHIVAEQTQSRADACPANYFDVVFGSSSWVEDPSRIVPVYAAEVINPGVPLGMSTLPRGSAVAEFLAVSHDDLALLLLGGSAPASPIPLAPVEPIIGQRLQLSGFGQMAIGMNTRGWAQGTVTHFAADRSGFFVRSTGSREASTSPGPGDSGGPAISISPSGSPQVSGVVSGGKWLFPELERTRMEMYASIAPHRAWITSTAERLLAEDWQHSVQKSAGATRPWYRHPATYVALCGAAAVGVGVVAAAASSRARRGRGSLR